MPANEFEKQVQQKMEDAIKDLNEMQKQQDSGH